MAEDSPPRPVVIPAEEDWWMAEKEMPQPLKVGDMVRIRYSGFKRGKIIEEWGALGPGGKLVYRILVSRKPKPIYLDVTEDQIKLIPKKA